MDQAASVSPAPAAPAPGNMALKRSHSPEDVPRDDGAQAAPKRARSGEDDRPPLADAYLEGLPRADLVQLLKQVEQLVHQTPQAADVRALLYPCLL